MYTYRAVKKHATIYIYNMYVHVDGWTLECLYASMYLYITNTYRKPLDRQVGL